METRSRKPLIHPICATFAAVCLLTENPTSAASLVTLDADGVHAEGYLQGGKVSVFNGEDGITGIQVNDGTDFYVNGKPLPLILELTGEQSIGIDLGNGELYFGADVKISAQTAVTGSGYLQFDDSKSVQINGRLDMKAGTLVAFDSQVQYTGSGELAELMVQSANTADASFTVGAGDENIPGFLRVGTLDVSGGRVFVNGLSHTPDIYYGNTVLMVKDVVQDPVYGNAGSIAVTGSGVLVLGTHLDEDGSDEAQIVRRLNDIIATTQVEINTRITSTLITQGTSFTVPDTVTVTVGTVASAQPGTINIGADGRWVYIASAQSEAVQTLDETSAAEVSVNLEEGAQFVLYGWDGKTEITGVDLSNLSPENFYSIGGVRASLGDDGKIVRVWSYQIPGLKAVEMVKYVETQDVNTAYAGYNFINAALDEGNVGDNAFARVVDGAVYLPVTSGLAAAGERAAAAMFETVIAHDATLFEGKGHWWADAKRIKNDADSIFGATGFEADTVTGALGYDFTLGAGWIATVAASFASIDTQTRGRSQAGAADVAMAGVTVAATGEVAGFEVRAAASYMRASGDADMRVMGYRLESETDADFYSFAARVSKVFSADAVVCKPYVQAGVHAASMSESSIDVHYDTVSGTGFKTEAKDRWWGSVEAGFDLSASLRSGQYRLEPSVGAAYATSYGDTDWIVTTAFADGNGASQGTFESALKNALRLRASLKIAGDGFNEAEAGQTDGQTQPWAWAAFLTAGFEKADGSEQSSYFGLNFKQLF